MPGRSDIRPVARLAKLRPYTRLIEVAFGAGRRGLSASTSRPEPAETILTDGKFSFGLQSRPHDVAREDGDWFGLPDFIPSTSSLEIARSCEVESLRYARGVVMGRSDSESESAFRLFCA